MVGSLNGSASWIGVVSTTHPGQVVQAKKGEQVPSFVCFCWLEELACCSAQQSSTLQQGINVPAVIMKRSIMASHLFIHRKGR